MVLIPKEAVKNFQVVDTKLLMNRSDKSYDTVVTQLDQEMNEILCSTAYQNEREKWNAYSKVLERYLRLINHESCPAVRPLLTQNDNETDESIYKSTDHNINQSDIDSVPKKFQSKAKLLYRHLKNMPDNIILWDNSGIVSIEGRIILGSNIIDLLNDAVSHGST